MAGVVCAVMPRVRIGPACCIVLPSLCIVLPFTVFTVTALLVWCGVFVAGCVSLWNGGGVMGV